MTAAVRPTPRLALRRLAWRGPEAWVVALVGGAWAVVATRSPWLGVGVGGAPGHGAHHALASSSSPSAGALAGLVGAALMALAMMVPLARGALRHVVRTGFWSRRHRGAALFVAAFAGLWTVVGAALTVLVDAVTGAAGAVATVAVLFAVAVGWQLGPAHHRALTRCARTIPMAPRGWAADRDCLRYGALSALGCVRTCWAVMAALAATGHAVVPMVAVGLVLHVERTRRRPPVREAAALVAATGVVATLAAGLSLG